MHRVALLAVVVIFPPRSSTMLFTSSLFFDSFPRTRIFMLVSGLSRGSEITQHVSNRHRAPQTNNKHKGTASPTVSIISPAGRETKVQKQVWPVLSKWEEAPLHLGKATKLNTCQQTEGMKGREGGYVGTLFACLFGFFKWKKKKISRLQHCATRDCALLSSSFDAWTAWEKLTVTWKLLPLQNEICFWGAGERGLSLKQQCSYITVH